MGAAEAKAHYDKQAGDPTTGFISADDAKAAIDQMYTDLEVGPGSITHDKIGTGAVHSGNIGVGEVTQTRLADGAVSTAKLDDNAVTHAKLADNAVDAAAIQDGAVTPSKLAAARFVFPTGATGGYGFNGGAVNLSGTGSPEGVVTATPGSTWLQTDATTDVKGWLRWIKASGTGNTGWRVGPEADTGWRNISAGLINGWVCAHLLVRRVGSTVFMRTGGLTTLDGSSATANSCMNPFTALGAGFMPRLTTSAEMRFLMCKNTGTPTTPVAVYTYWHAASGSFEPPSKGTVNDKFVFFENGTGWHTPDAWPASLPGTAA